MTDRTYMRWGPAWHAFRDYVPHEGTMWYRAACGRTSEFFTQDADRVPAAGHLCGSCARVIAAQTDQETRSLASFARTRAVGGLPPDLSTNLDDYLYGPEPMSQARRDELLDDRRADV